MPRISPHVKKRKKGKAARAAKARRQGSRPDNTRP